MRNALLAAAALVVSGSLASAGEGLGLKVEAGLEFAVAEKFAARIDEAPADVLDHGGRSVLAAVTVSKQFTAEWSASLRIRGSFGFGDSGAEVMEADAETDFDGFDAGALAGYTFRVGERFAVTPVLGLSWRAYSVEGERDDFPVEARFDAGLLTLDLGARAALRLSDALEVGAAVLVGLPLAGSSRMDGNFAPSDDRADLDGGLFYALSAGAEYRLSEAIALTGGLAYEAGRVDWEWDDLDSEGDDEFSRFSIRLGAALRF
jgi:hypothetical protein